MGVGPGKVQILMCQIDRAGDCSKLSERCSSQGGDALHLCQSLLRIENRALSSTTPSATEATRGRLNDVLMWWGQRSSSDDRLRCLSYFWLAQIVAQAEARTKSPPPSTNIHPAVHPSIHPSICSRLLQGVRSESCSRQSGSKKRVTSVDHDPTILLLRQMGASWLILIDVRQLDVHHSPGPWPVGTVSCGRNVTHLAVHAGKSMMCSVR